MNDNILIRKSPKSKLPVFPEFITHFLKFCKQDEEDVCEFYEMSMRHGGKCAHAAGAAVRICTNPDAVASAEVDQKLEDI